VQAGFEPDIGRDAMPGHYVIGFGYDGDNSPYGEQYYAGLLDYGFWHARSQDGVGLFFTYFSVSGALGKVQAEEAALGLPFSDRATGIQTHEMILEANYNIQGHRGLDFRPEFQYVFRPNAQSDIANAAVFGFKAFAQF
jgi:porin